ncbi:uncharacterized protein DUF3788 [Anaerobacterium chartisolvens]|uniref:Uncharacterized protein DUF3788 n=1 Tax=Anaerobacterium chartisolvens TaxID=1297424 RepID=A0A369B4D6_9FIRM|nr:DUF3788 domain-containing protein [Anaerobacterium chartisolvens]RCX16343.1 uncharacterized protein DUF3788 [Anaerobacterium chartisolvens]
MKWNILYDQNNPPALNDIEKYVGSGLWENLNTFLKSTYGIQPKLSYSRCSMQPGWNVKYQKSGKSLCTLYPMDGFFIALIVVGSKESSQAELLLPSFSKYTQDLYKGTPFSAGGRWMMINVTEHEILEDVVRLIQIRVKPKQPA